MIYISIISYIFDELILKDSIMIIEGFESGYSDWIRIQNPFNYWIISFRISALSDPDRKH